MPTPSCWRHCRKPWRRADDAAALEVFRAATVPAPLLQPAHDFATAPQPRPILWRDSGEESHDTNNAGRGVERRRGSAAGVCWRTRQEYRRAGDGERRCKGAR